MFRRYFLNCVLETFFLLFQIIVQQAQQRYYEMLELKTKFEYLEAKESYNLRKCTPFCNTIRGYPNNTALSND